MKQAKFQLLSGGKLVQADSIQKADILICGEKIHLVGAHIDKIPPECRIIDCTGKLIFPGIIDPHIHVRSENSASHLMLAGGVTTALDFSRHVQGTALLDNVLSRQCELFGLLPDIKVHCTISHVDERILKEIPVLVERGITSFRVVTTAVGGCHPLKYAEIERLAEKVVATGAIITVHAEDDLVIQQATEHLRNKKRTQPQYFGLSRPAIAETNAIRKLGNIALRTGCKISISNLSTAAGLELAIHFPSLILETCPQYLFLDENVYNRSDGRMFLDCPPLRRQSDNQVLWDGVLSGKIQTIGSNHRAYSLSEKPDDSPFFLIPKGMPGSGTLFPLLLAKFMEDGADIRLLAKLLCENPARIFGLYPHKGTLAMQADADLLIVNPATLINELEELPCTAGLWHPYRGLPAIFPETVYLRGKAVIDGNSRDFRMGEFIPSSFHN